MADKKLILPRLGPPSARTSLGGLLLPPTAQNFGAANTESTMGFVNTYITWEEITGTAMAEAEVVARLSRISAYDALQAIGRLSCMVFAGDTMSTSQQVLILRRLGAEPADIEQTKQVIQAAGPDGRRTVFFPQQLIHLARLSVLHCDPRPGDDFAGGTLRSAFLESLFGVTDCLSDGELVETEEADGVQFVLRQSGVNHRHDSSLLWSRYYDILVRCWDEVATPEAFDAAAAFARYTGLSFRDWLAVGFSINARFLTYGTGASVVIR